MLNLRARSLMALFVCALFLVFVRDYKDETVFFVPRADDSAGYFIYSETLFRTHTFDWCDQGFTVRYFCPSGNEKNYNRYSIGPALTVAPMQAVGVLLKHYGIFTPNVDELLFWWIVGTILLFWLSLLILLDCTYLVLDKRISSYLFVAFFTVGNPLLYYVFRVPTLSHATEFFWLLLTIACCLRAKRSSSKLSFVFGVAFAAGMLVITRYNNLYVVLLSALWLFRDFREISFSEAVQRGSAFICGLFMPVGAGLFFLSRQLNIFNIPPYDNYSNLDVMLRLNEYTFLRAASFFVGPHWGFIWIMPFTFLLAALITLALVRAKIEFGRNLVGWGLAAALLSIQIGLMANYPHDGMNYGLRYLFSLLVLMYLGGVYAAKRLSFSWNYMSVLICILFSVAGSGHLLNFEMNDSTLFPTTGNLSDAATLSPRFSDLTGPRVPLYAFHSFQEMRELTPLRAMKRSPVRLLHFNGKIAFKKAGIRGLVGYAISDILFQFFLATVFCLLMASVLPSFRWERIYAVVRGKNIN